MVSPIAYLQALYRQWRISRQEQKIQRWIEKYRPDPWEDLTLEGYKILNTREIGPQTAAAIMSGFERILIADCLTPQHRRLTLAVLLLAIRRSHVENLPVHYYRLKTIDLTAPEGPDDNRRWKDWYDALAYLLPEAPFLELEKLPHPTYLIQRVFDVDMALVVHRRRQLALGHDPATRTYLPAPSLTF